VSVMSHKHESSPNGKRCSSPTSEPAGSRRRYTQLGPLLILALLPINCPGTAARIGRQTASSRQPSRLTCDESRNDLGRVPLSLTQHNRTTSFAVTNHSDQTVRFRKFVVSCGCVLATAVPQTLHAGQDGRIDVQVKTDQPGERSATIIAFTDSTKTPRLELKMLWHTVAPVEILPDVVDFGSVTPGSAVSRSIRFSPSEFVDIPDDVIKFEPLKSDDLQATIADAHTMVIDLHAGSQVGAFREILTIQTTAGTMPAQQVPIRWKVRPVIACEPPSEFVGLVGRGESLTATFVIHSSGPPIDVSQSVQLDTNDGLPTIRCEQLGRYVARVTVSAIAPTVPGAFEVVIPLAVTATGEHVVQVAMTGIVRQDESEQSRAQ
jgi:Protein of unknown function (DUF1573)